MPWCVEFLTREVFIHLKLVTLLVWRWFCGSVNSVCRGSTQQDLSKDFIWFDSLDGWREGGSWCLHEVQQTLHTFDWFGLRRRSTNRVRCQNPSTTQSVILVSRLHAFKSMQGFLPLGRLVLFQYGASVWSFDVVQKCWTYLQSLSHFGWILLTSGAWDSFHGSVLAVHPHVGFFCFLHWLCSVHWHSICHQS